MPALFDASSNKQINGVGNDSFTHTPVGTPTCAVLTLHIDRINADGSAATYGGQAMTFFGALETSNARVEIWIKDSPLSGAQTVAYTLANAANGWASCHTYTGDTASRTALVSKTFTSIILTLEVGGANDDVSFMAAIVKNSTTGTVFGSENERLNQNEGNGNTRSLVADATGADTLTYTLGVQRAWAAIGFAFGAGGGGVADTESAPAFDAVSSHVNSAVNFFTHTPVGVPSSVMVSAHIDRTNADSAGITYGGVAMSLLDAQEGSASRLEIWVLDDPPRGPQEVQVPAVGAANTQYACATYTGSPTRTTPVKNTATSGTVSLAIGGAGQDLSVIAAIVKNSTTATADGGANSRFNQHDGNGNTRALVSDLVGAATLSWTLGTSDKNWAAVGFAFEGPAVDTGPRRLEGVGSLLGGLGL